MPPFRPVNSQVNSALGPMPQGPFNYGLFFQKWFYVSPEEKLKCPTDGKKDRNSQDRISLEDNMKISIDLFNEGVSRTSNGETGKWDRKFAEKILADRLESIVAITRAYGRLGYVAVSYDAEILSPLVVGLGNEHPTEKGFRFDWTTGIPCVPASSIKGVVRLAHLVNELNEFDDTEQARDFWRSAESGVLTETAKTLFGCGDAGKNGEQPAQAGRVIFLDAWPTRLPKLKSEIMNCHYPDYLNKGERGPTEDQQPNPQKFWAVDTSTPAGGKVIFRFVALVEPKAKDMIPLLENSIVAALTEHGLGAKTAIGHGRFLARKSDILETRVEAAPRESPGSRTQQDPASIFASQLKNIKAHELPNRIAPFIEQVKCESDPESRKSKTRVLAEKIQENKEVLKKARKDQKSWFVQLNKLCEENGIPL